MFFIEYTQPLNIFINQINISKVASVSKTASVSPLKNLSSKKKQHQLSSAFTYTVLPNETLQTFINDLSARGVIHDSALALLACEVMSPTTKIKVGHYVFPVHVSLQTLLQQLSAHKVHYIPITLVDGWTFARLRDALNANPQLKHNVNENGHALMRNLNGKGMSAEGQFLPQTYYISSDKSEMALLKRAHNALQDELMSEWAGRVPNLALKTPQQALTLASLVELEARHTSEMPIIASVFYNRLRLGMPLQSDPTVLFAASKPYGSAVTRHDLHCHNRYNTYRYAGLPPGPVALPSKAAIHAVLHPQQTNFLYFVAKGNGYHDFSRTLAEQNRAVHHYQGH